MKTKEPKKDLWSEVAGMLVSCTIPRHWENSTEYDATRMTEFIEKKIEEARQEEREYLRIELVVKAKTMGGLSYKDIKEIFAK